MKNLTIVVLVLAIICSLIVVPVSAADDAAEKHIHSLNEIGVCTACEMNVLSLLNTAYIYSFPLVLMD
ncbi:MAG: hypothetical protein IJ325_04085, partial [Clostridia bacterium]|nr:hypothetical protein [Clostridia bacterium]